MAAAGAVGPLVALLACEGGRSKQEAALEALAAISADNPATSAAVLAHCEVLGLIQQFLKPGCQPHTRYTACVCLANLSSHLASDCPNSKQAGRGAAAAAAAAAVALPLLLLPLVPYRRCCCCLLLPVLPRARCCRGGAGQRGVGVGPQTSSWLSKCASVQPGSACLMRPTLSDRPPPSQCGWAPMSVALSMAAECRSCSKLCCRCWSGCWGRQGCMRTCQVS